MANIKDPVLAQVEERVEQQLTDPATRQNYEKIVVAGMHVALDKGPDGMLAQLKNSKDPIHDCAVGAVGLVQGMRRQAKGVMPVKAMIPAAMTLMIKGLDFVNSTGIAKVGNEELERATQAFSDAMFRSLGISRGMIAKIKNKVGTLIQDPVAMEKIKQKAGAVKHPNASEPTPIPQE